MLAHIWANIFFVLSIFSIVVDSNYFMLITTENRMQVILTNKCLKLVNFLFNAVIFLSLKISAMAVRITVSMIDPISTNISSLFSYRFIIIIIYI